MEADSHFVLAVAVSSKVGAGADAGRGVDHVAEGDILCGPNVDNGRRLTVKLRQLVSSPSHEGITVSLTSIIAFVISSAFSLHCSRARTTKSGPSSPITWRKYFLM